MRTEIVTTTKTGDKITMTTEATKTARIKKTPLTNHKRAIIRAFAMDAMAKVIRAELKMDKSDAAMREFMLKQLESEFPAADMQVLKKYDQVRSCTCLSFVIDHNRDDYHRFEFGHDIITPRRSSCHAINVTGKIPTEWVAKQEQFENQTDEKRKQFNALLNTARFFEDVLEVFPSAEVLRGQLGATVTAVSTLNDSIKASIMADSKKIAKVLESTND